jgi:hypothetical protein
MTLYKSSCHCGGVELEIDTEYPLGPYFKCNCSLCARKGAIMGAAPRSAVTVKRGSDLISTYTWNTHEAQHFFCQTCGIYTHHVMRGETTTMGLNMACVDGVDVFALGEVPIGNGKDEWSVLPPESAA